MTERLTLSIAESAVTLGVSRAAVYAAVKSGQIQALHFGRRVVISKAVLTALLEPKREPTKH